MQHDIHISPEEIMGDFELTLVLSLELQFLDARIHGCSILPVEEYEYVSIRSFIQKKRLMLLSHQTLDGLPDEQVERALPPSYTWLNGQFRPNDCMHSITAWKGLQENSLYEILKLFQREQAATELTIQQLKAGGVNLNRMSEEKIKLLAANEDGDIDLYFTSIKHCFILSTPFKVLLTHTVEHLHPSRN